MLREAEYGLLIADIRMPGNAGLELIREVPQVAKGLPVILVTGYPSLDTTLESLELRVAGYLVKPIDIDKLLGLVRLSINRRRILQGVSCAVSRLEQGREELAELEGLLVETPPDAFPEAAETFLAHTYRNIASSLLDRKVCRMARRKIRVATRLKGSAWILYCSFPKIVSISESA